MGGLSHRSGTVLLCGVSGQANANCRQALERARFQVIEDISLIEDDPPGALAVLLGIDGPDACTQNIQELRLRAPGAALIGIITHPGDASPALVSAFRSGIIDAVDARKSVDDLVPSVKLAIERRRIQISEERISEAFTRELGRRARRLGDAVLRIEDAYEETLAALVAMLDLREQATAGHSIRVGYYTCYLAREVGYTRRALQDVYRGAVLHDIGKIAIPDAILLKPGPLTDEEREVMKTHTMIGRGFVERVPHLHNAVQIPWCHHERWDGTGYPRGLQGEEIPIPARMFALCDVYDALRSERCYKKALTHAESLAIMLPERGAHFDPELFDIFKQIPESLWATLHAASTQANTRFETMLDVFGTLETPETHPSDLCPTEEIRL